MPEVKTRIELLDITQKPGELIERIAEISYRTQRFMERKNPKLVKFISGRTVPFDELGLEEEPTIGEPLPGYSKDDVAVSEIIQPSWEKVVKFLLAIGHHAIFECCHVTFLLENITRKAALHLLRYRFCTFNMQSQKYQPQGGFNYLLPQGNQAKPGTRRMIDNYMKTLQSIYEDLRKTGIDPEWSRCCYPNNVAQTLTMSTNFRQLRHMFDCLCDDDYVPENQSILLEMLKIVKNIEPVFFHDYEIAADGKSAIRRAKKYARNVHVNWNLPKEMRAEFGLDIPQQPKGKETDID